MKLTIRSTYRILFILLIGIAGINRSSAQCAGVFGPSYDRSCLTDYFTSISIHGAGVTGASITSTGCTVPFHNNYPAQVISAPTGSLVKVDISRFTAAYPGPGGYTAYLSMWVSVV